MARGVGDRAVSAGDIADSTVVTGDHVTVLQGTGTAFTTSSPADWAAATKRSVEARRRLRRERLGLTREQVNASFKVEDALPDELRDLRPGEIRVLTGPLGAGKSDLAERWLFASAEQYGALQGSGPVPLWISASEVEGTLHDHVVRVLGRADVLRTSGGDLVVDGLDERPAAAAAFLEQAQVLVAVAPLSRVVLSAREGVPVPEAITVAVREWDRDAALRLIAAVAGVKRHYHLDHDWPDSLRQTTRRPFFGLLAGAYMGNGMPSTGAGLIDRAVRQALGMSAPTQALRAVAVQRTRTGRPVDMHALAAEDADALLASRLLVVHAGRAVFALPIFEQWFAAQALLRLEVLAADVFADTASFARWRYAAAVAIAAGDSASVDHLMSVAARWNPGAAAWLVEEAISSRLSLGDRGEALGDWLSVGTAIREATCAWVTGLGPAADLVDPVRHLPGDGADPLSGATLCVAVEGSRIQQSWASSDAVPGPVAYGAPLSFQVERVLEAGLASAWAQPHRLLTGFGAGRWTICGRASRSDYRWSSVAPRSEGAWSSASGRTHASELC